MAEIGPKTRNSMHTSNIQVIGRPQTLTKLLWSFLVQYSPKCHPGSRAYSIRCKQLKGKITLRNRNATYLCKKTDWQTILNFDHHISGGGTPCPPRDLIKKFNSIKALPSVRTYNVILASGGLLHSKNTCLGQP